MAQLRDNGEEMSLQIQAARHKEHVSQMQQAITHHTHIISSLRNEKQALLQSQEAAQLEISRLGTVAREYEATVRKLHVEHSHALRENSYMRSYLKRSEL